jgi:hypothetical protein
MATFITSKAIGQTIKIDVYTTTGYWKYNHNGTDSSLYQDGSQTITITSLNSQFTLFACNSIGDIQDENGNVYGNIRHLDFEENGEGNKITHINITGYYYESPESLTYLNLYNNLLTTFDGTGLSSLTDLSLGKNLLTSFSSTGLSNLTSLSLKQNQLTSFNGNGLSNLTSLNLENNPITNFTKGTGLSNLSSLYLDDNRLTSFTGTGLTNLGYLYLKNNLLTSFDGTDLFKLDILQLNGNPLVSFISGDILMDGMDGI